MHANPYDTSRGLSVRGGRVQAMLSVRDKMTLDFEASWWKYPGAKETAIRDTFDETATRYYQRLNALIDRPEALAHAPMIVRRLLRLRAARAEHRSAIAAGFEIS